MNLLSKNPELQRNIWISLTPQRLVLMPLFIGIIIFLWTGGKVDASGTFNIGPLTLFIYTVIAFGWGTKSAGDGLLDEHNDKTWDWQRMSSIGPWRMLVGKLVGGPIYQWYGGLICLLIYVINGFENGYAARSLTVAAMAFLFTILGYSLVLLTSLLHIRKASEKAKIKSGAVFVIWFVISIPILLFAYLNQWLFDSYSSVFWYGITFNALSISFLFVAFYTIWSVIGLYRGLRVELQYVTSARGWITFLISSVIFNAGLFTNNPDLNTSDIIINSLILAIGFYLLLVYYLILAEPKDAVNFRQILRLIGKRSFKELGEIAPLWVVTLPLAFIIGILTLLFISIYEPVNGYHSVTIDLKDLDKTTLLGLLFSVFAFVVRDLALVLWINLGKATQRANLNTIIYLIFVYLIAPAVLSGQQIGFVFFPDPSSNVFLLVMVPVLEAFAAIYLLNSRWKSVNRNLIY
jgi:hypothetical protein